MKRDEIINLADKHLSAVPKLRIDIKEFDNQLRAGSTDNELTTKRKQKSDTLNSILRAVGTLSQENQRIICYRYFDGLQLNHIAIKDWA